MPNKPGKFRWSNASEKAAVLVAARDLTYDQIADSLDVARRTLWNWRQNEEFRARVDRHLAEYREEIARIGIADRHKRIAGYNDRRNRLRRVIEARADDPSMKSIPGGPTGLLCRTVKGIGRGDDFEVVEIFSVDTGLLRELRDLEKQAAQELGQWSDKHEVGGSDGGAVLVTFGQSLDKAFGDGDHDEADDPTDED